MAELFESLSSLDDIQSLIKSGIRESEVLEYKRATRAFTDVDRHEIAKDISAMANSLGGLIIYGVATHSSDKTLPERIEPIMAVNIETMDRVINSQIRPPIQGLRKKLIPAVAAELMIIDVPASDDPPHQDLYDKRYYRRSGSESLAMEHDLVALKFGRKLSPILQLKVQPLSEKLDLSEDPLWSKEVGLRLIISNVGRRIGRYIHILIKLPDNDAVRIRSGGETRNINELYKGIQARQFTDNSSVYHPGMNVSITEIQFQVSASYAKKRSDEPFIDCTLFADEMSPMEVQLSLNQLGWLLGKD